MQANIKNINIYFLEVTENKYLHLNVFKRLDVKYSVL